jgi:hypothetical protein
MNQAQVETKVRELIGLIKTTFRCSNGLLARNYPPTNRTIFDNFDDVAPFFLFFGEEDFLVDQIRHIRRLGENMLSLCTADGVLLTRDIDEWFGGLYSIWRSTEDEEVHRLLVESVEFILTNLVEGHFLSAAFFCEDQTIAPYYEPWSAGLLETFCEMRDDFAIAFEKSQDIMQGWLEDEYFQAYGLFPYRVFANPVIRFIQKRFLAKSWPTHPHSRPVSPRVRGIYDVGRLMRFYSINGRYSQLMKSNSTCAFALLELFLATGDRFWADNLSRWIESAVNGFCNEGVTYFEILPQIGCGRNPGVVPAFILVDVICDSVYSIPELRAYLSTAQRILDHQWANRLETGLVPLHEGGKFVHIDSQVDLSISLRRYSELTGDDLYLRRSAELVECVIREHYSPEGYFTFSGEVSNNTIDPKYNALLLKGMVNLLTLGQSLYQNPGLYSLFKDR